jgi:hypothetical protein
MDFVVLSHFPIRSELFVSRFFPFLARKSPLDQNTDDDPCPSALCSTGLGTYEQVVYLCFRLLSFSQFGSRDSIATRNFPSNIYQSRAKQKK